MQKLVDCPACEGRGRYCQHALDPVWSELTISESPCEFCNGVGRIAPEIAADYDLERQPLAYPYREM